MRSSDPFTYPTGTRRIRRPAVLSAEWPRAHVAETRYLNLIIVPVIPNNNRSLVKSGIIDSLASISSGAHHAAKPLACMKYPPLRESRDAYHTEDGIQFAHRTAPAQASKPGRVFRIRDSEIVVDDVDVCSPTNGHDASAILPRCFEVHVALIRRDWRIYTQARRPR